MCDCERGGSNSCGCGGGRGKYLNFFSLSHFLTCLTFFDKFDIGGFVGEMVSSSEGHPHIFSTLALRQSHAVWCACCYFKEKRSERRERVPHFVGFGRWPIFFFIFADADAVRARPALRRAPLSPMRSRAPGPFSQAPRVACNRPGQRARERESERESRLLASALLPFVGGFRTGSLQPSSIPARPHPPAPSPTTLDRNALLALAVAVCAAVAVAQGACLLVCAL